VEQAARAALRVNQANPDSLVRLARVEARAAQPDREDQAGQALVPGVEEAAAERAAGRAGRAGRAAVATADVKPTATNKLLPKRAQKQACTV